MWSEDPPGASESLSRDLQGENYFHNKTKTFVVQYNEDTCILFSPSLQRVL